MSNSNVSVPRPSINPGLIDGLATLGEGTVIIRADVAPREGLAPKSFKIVINATLKPAESPKAPQG